MLARVCTKEYGLNVFVDGRAARQVARLFSEAFAAPDVLFDLIEEISPMETRVVKTKCCLIVLL